ncbi:TetR-like C-terminal domain-containing protein [Streptomyces mirabilis]
MDKDVRKWARALARDFVDPIRADRIRAVTSAASEDPATAERLYERFTQVQRTGLIDRLRVAAAAGRSVAPVLGREEEHGQPRGPVPVVVPLVAGAVLDEEVALLEVTSGSPGGRGAPSGWITH